MKMKDADYSALKQAILTALPAQKFIEQRAEYAQAGHSSTRFLWDALHFSKINTRELYRYLNDSHIETALRRIASEVTA
jgi:hypothetical protein